MARNASKKTSTTNDATLRLLSLGFLLTNLYHVVVRFVLLRHRLTFWHGFKYTATEGIAVLLWWQLSTMARQGHALDQPGLTAYMLDVVYVTWFTHILAATAGRWGWWVYALIPGYALYLGYTKVVVPYFFKGANPLAALLPGSAGGRSSGQKEQPQQQGEQISKRQAKLQARAERGDPRVQVRKR
ncbi:hypothetical protein ACQY0O_007841 [Thecaphora frezii]